MSMVNKSKLQSHFDTHVFPGLLSSGQDLRDIQLTRVQSVQVESCLLSDSRDYLYSSVVSFADAMHGLASEYSSWPIVSLYYSVFYACRSALASVHKTGLFYFSAESPSKLKPYALEVVTGGKPKKKDGTTHAIILKLYKNKESTMTHSLLTDQSIDSKDPLTWLKEQREIANYRQSTFTEPGRPDCLERIGEIGVGRSLASYIDDIEEKTYIYTFDPKHAVIALPLLLLSESVRYLNSGDDEDKIFPRECRDFLTRKLVDESGNELDILRRLLLP